MLAGLQIVVFLLAAVAFVAFIALRSGVALPILLVAAGVIISVAPGVPPFVLEPQFVLLLVLPPVIYISAVNMSWREFKFNLEPILLLAVGCVVFTTVSVSFAMNCCSAGLWRSASCSAPSSRRPTPSRRSPLPGACNCPGVSLSFWKARASPMTPPRWCSIASRWRR